MHAIAIPLLAFLSTPLVNAAAVPACVPGSKATSGGLYSVNCGHIATNISEALSWAHAQPSFSSCLAACDNNIACQAISWWPNECLLFPDFDEASNFWPDDRPGSKGMGAVAKCKNGPYKVPGGKTFSASCHAGLGEPDGFIGNPTASTFHGCMAQCSKTAGCVAVTYSQSLQSCGLWKNPGSMPDHGSTDDDMMAIVN